MCHPDRQGAYEKFISVPRTLQERAFAALTRNP